MRTLFACLALPLALLLARAAGASEPDPAARQAAKHFQRGVTLYSEADYRAALVEFKRAYSLSPNAAVLYNVGETEYQLQDYAGALTAFEHFLAASSANDARRTEVETNVETLRARVGYLNITTVPMGADVVIDDVPAGKTPFDKPLRVSIGRRHITASMPGRAPVVREVDVAADDNVLLTIELPSTGEVAAAPALSHSAPADESPPSKSISGSTWRTVGWVATASLAAGSIASGILALNESSDLRNARNAYPASSSTLGHDSSLTTTYSLLADTLAAAAFVTGGITLISTLTSSSSSSSAPNRGSTGPMRIVLGPASAKLDVTF